MAKSIEDRIAFLKKCDVAYEEGEPLISDDSYDLEKEELKKIASAHDYFKNIGGLTSEGHGWQKKHTHKYPMGSLSKDKSPEDAEDWLSKTYPNTTNLSLVLQPKLDGSATVLIFDNHKLQMICSRGDGIVGYDITNVARYIRNIPETIDEGGYVEVKGECVKDKASFYKIWAPQGFNDPRSFVAGTLNAKPASDIEQIMKERAIAFIAYETRGKTFDTEINKIKFLEDNKFRTLKNSTAKINCTGRTHKDIVGAIKKYMEKLDRDNYEFQLDGAVIKNNDIVAGEKLGVVNLKPKSSRAVKFPCEQKTAIIERIEWTTGKSGVVTPVAILKPVFVSGATITRATLHNIKEIERLGIDQVPYRAILIRSGDIIPKLVKGEGPESGAKPFSIPTKCPSCNGVLNWDASETNKVCDNSNCPAQLSGKIDYYLKTLGIKGIGSSTIDVLIEKGYVKSLPDMYDLARYKELSDVFGDKAFENILEAMNSIKEITLAGLIRSLSIAKIGTMSSKLCEVAPTIKEMDDLKASDITSIEGFGPIKAKSFVEGWAEQRKEIDRLLKYITIKEKSVAASNNKLGSKSFCITGTLSISRNDMQKKIEDNGGKVSSSVSAKLDYLICGEDSGSKKDKAEKLGVKVISEQDFDKMMR